MFFPFWDRHVSCPSKTADKIIVLPIFILFLDTKWDTGKYMHLFRVHVKCGGKNWYILCELGRHITTIKSTSK